MIFFMNIPDYPSYFHDGSIIAIKQNEKIIEIRMESSEIIPEWGVKVPLTNRNTIAGNLILFDVKKIFIDKTSAIKLSWEFDSCEILSFEISGDAMDLFVRWCNYPPKERTSKYESIIIQASQIEWENMPEYCNENN